MIEFEDEEIIFEVLESLEDKLSAIYNSLRSLHKKLNYLTTMTQSEFDTFIQKFGPALDDVKNDVTQVKTDTEALLAKAKAAGVDLSSEADTLQGSLDGLLQSHTDLQTIHTEATS